MRQQEVKKYVLRTLLSVENVQDASNGLIYSFEERDYHFVWGFGVSVSEDEDEDAWIWLKLEIAIQRNFVATTRMSEQVAFSGAQRIHNLFLATEDDGTHILVAKLSLALWGDLEADAIIVDRALTYLCLEAESFDPDTFWMH